MRRFSASLKMDLLAFYYETNKSINSNKRTVLHPPPVSSLFFFFVNYNYIFYYIILLHFFNKNERGFPAVPGKVGELR